MRKQVNVKLFAAIGTGLTLALLLTTAGQAGPDPRVYNNLMKSRDALLTQQQYLQKALDNLQQQAKDLDDKIASLRNYMDQNDQALRDVDRAIRQAGF